MGSDNSAYDGKRSPEPLVAKALFLAPSLARGVLFGGMSASSCAISFRRWRYWNTIEHLESSHISVVFILRDTGFLSVPRLDAEVLAVNDA
jgi:hypothetical protein